MAILEKGKSKTNPEPWGDGPFGFSEADQQQRNVFVATFAMLAKLAGADGKIAKREADEIERFISQVLNLDPARTKFAATVFNESRRSKETFSAYAERYRELLKDKPRMLEWMIDVLLRLSCADEALAAAEESLIKEACVLFGIPEERYQQLKKRHLGDIDDIPYQVLGCTHESSDEEVTKKYHAKCEEYSPQRIKDFGLPAEFVKLAEDRYQEINDVYDKIRKLRGF